MKDGNNKDYNINGGIGLISSRLSVEGPIQKKNLLSLFQEEERMPICFLKLLKIIKTTNYIFMI
jgi:hypothetical protein